MNRIYRTLWSVATQSWQAVPETAKSSGKKSKSSASGVVASFALSWVLTSAANAQAPPAINQLPTGGTVARGTATISQTATAQAAAMTVNQTSQRAVVNWNTFNIGSNASVNFVQPNAQAVTLNRVSDSNPSQIFGRMSANGQVVLTNANGVYFAPGSSVDVGAITATTHSITNDNFMSGKLVFDRSSSSGKVVNEGSITAALGGYVALLAPEVQNAGVVVARAGTVAMAAGETITLALDGVGSLAGITTTPSAIATLIENKHAVQAPDGQIVLSAVALNKLLAGVIRNSGSLEANSLVSKGGKIVLEADDITLTATSKLEAKGATGGGTVLVGGDWQGSGDLRQATKVTMEAGAAIDASATDKGYGGKVVLWSDIHNAESVTQVEGRIDAKAAANGNGGQVETSGHQLKIGDSATVDTTGGQWLLDPYDFTVASSGGNITGTNLSSLLASNSITITASTTASTSDTATSKYGSTGTLGDIYINDNVTWGANDTLANGKTLTLVAANNVYVNASMNPWGNAKLTVTATSGNLLMGLNNAPASSGGGFYGSINFTTTQGGTTGRTGTGILTIGGQSYKLISSVGTATDLAGTTSLQGAGNTAYVAMATDIDASATSTWNLVSGSNYAGFKPLTSSGSNVFNGLGHVIKGLYINADATVTKVGLYGISPAKGIFNVGIDSASSINSQAVSTGNGTINNGTTLNAFTGAIAGQTYSDFAFIMSNSYSMASVNALGGAVGGIAGSISTGKATNLGSFGSVTVSVSDTVGTVVAGGMFGMNNNYSNYDTTISNSTSTANVSVAHLAGSGNGATQSLYAGGFIGYGAVLNVGVQGSAFTQNTASGNVSITGANSVDTTNKFQPYGAVAGGFVGLADGETRSKSRILLFSQNAATGNVSVNKGIAGGFAGYGVSTYDSLISTLRIRESYATGSVTATANDASNVVGGFIGVVYVQNGYLYLNNNYTTGSVTGNAGKAGGFLGGVVGSNVGFAYVNYNYSLSTPTGGTSNTTTISIPGAGAGSGPATVTPNYYLASGASGADNNLSGLNATATTGTTLWGQDPNINSGHPFLINNAPVSFTPTLSIKTSGTWGGLVANSANPVLYGAGVTGDTINLYDGNTSLGTVSVTGGNWAYQAGANIALGQHIYKATQTSTVSSTYVSKPSLVSTYYAMPVLYVLANTGLSMTYGDSTIPAIGYSLYTDAAATIASVGVTPLGSAVYTFNGASSPTNAGTYSLSYASGLTSINYNFAAASVSQTFTVNKANLTSIAASKTYDGLATVTAAQITSIAGVNNETFTATSGTANISGKNVAGSKTLTDISGLTLTSSNGGLASNYYLDSAHLPTGLANAVTISQANLTFAAGTDSKTYDGTTSSSVAVVVTGKAASDTVVASQAFADKNVLGTLGSTLQIASGYTIKDSNNADMSGNYNITTATAAGTISKATLTLAASSDSKTYDGTTNSTASVSVSGKAAPDTVVVTQEFTDKNALGAGNSTLQITSGYTIKDANNVDMSGNYVVNASTTAVGTISPATASIAAAKTYDGLITLTAPQITISGVNGETLSYTGTALLQSANVRDNASNYVSGLTALADNGTVLAANYVLPSQTAASARNTVTISKASATVTAGSSTTTYSGVAQNISGFTATGLVNGETEAVLTGVTASAAGTNAGTYTSTASGTDGNYNLTFVNGALTINKANATVTAGSSTTTYTGLAQSVSGFSATGLVNGETTSVLTGVTTSGGTGTNAGTYASTVSGTDTNYNLTFVDGALTINKAHLTVTANNASKTYGDTNPALSTTVTGFVNGETTAVLTGAGSATTTATTTTGAGTATIAASAGTLSASNYDFTNLVNGTLTINKANATITANSATTTYTGLAQSVIGFTASGLVNGETEAVLTGVTAGATRTNAGTYASTASGIDSNYNLSFVNGTFTINKADLTKVMASKTYDGLSTVSATQITAIEGVNGETFTASAGTALISDKNVLTANKTLTDVSGLTLVGNSNAALSSNYNLNSNLPAVGANNQVTINVKALSLSIPGATRVYDGSTIITPSGPVALSGVVVGDQVNLGTGNVTGFVDKNVGTNKTVTYTGLALSGNDAVNYALPVNPTSNANITPTSLSISGITAADKIYDAGTTATVNTANVLKTGLIGSDVVNVTATGSFTDKNVGTAKTVNLSSSYSGADAGNYIVIDQANTTASITPAPLTVTALDALKNFGAANPAFSVAISGYVGGETAATSGVTGVGAATSTATDLTDVGTAPITPSIGTLSATNYAFTTFVDGTLTIKPISAMNNAEVSTLIGAQLANLTSAQVSRFSATQLQVFSPQQLSALSPSQLAGLTNAQLLSLTPVQLAAISPARIASMTTDQLAGLSAHQVTSLTVSQLQALTATQFSAFSDAQLQALSASQVTAITTGQLSALTSEQINLLTSNPTASLAFNQILALTPAQITGVDSIQVARLTAAEIGSLSDAQLQALSVSQIAAIAPDHFSFLSPAQIMALSITQVINLTPEQLRGFSPTQVASISAAELAYFDARQLAAIGIYPKAETPAQPEADAVVAAAPVAEPTPTPALQTASTVAAPSAATSDNNKPFEAAIPVMTEVAAPTLVATAPPVPAAAQAPVTKPEGAPALSPRALQGLLFGNNTASSASTGVLPITILNNAQTKPVTAGVAFEQEADTISLRTTNAPAIPPISDKLVFSDKLTTFMVAAPNGDMVAFEGTVLNNRMIIVAPSIMAKRLARVEMNLVLAAAVTSLGKTNRVMLAELKGVLLDLR